MVIKSTGLDIETTLLVAIAIIMLKKTYKLLTMNAVKLLCYWPHLCMHPYSDCVCMLMVIVGNGHHVKSIMNEVVNESDQGRVQRGAPLSQENIQVSNIWLSN